MSRKKLFTTRPNRRRKKRLQIAVVGSSEPHRASISIAEDVGRVIASHGAVLICGGLGGMMAAACRGAKENGGRTVGILPTYDKNSANPYIDIAIPSGIGHARNVLVVAAGDIVVALAGSHGTRSEIAIALKLGKPVIGVCAWSKVTGVRYVRSIREFQKELLPFF